MFDLSEKESMSSDGSLSSYENIRDKKLENSKNIFNNVNNEPESSSDGKNSIKYNLTVYQKYIKQIIVNLI